jgi:hypothetical protein
MTFFMGFVVGAVVVAILALGFFIHIVTKFWNSK